MQDESHRFAGVCKELVSTASALGLRSTYDGNARFVIMVGGDVIRTELEFTYSAHPVIKLVFIEEQLRFWTVLPASPAHLEQLVMTALTDGISATCRSLGT